MMTIRKMVFLATLILAAVPAIPRAGLAAQVEIELFAPAREAASAIQAARRADAAALAPQDLRLADLYLDDATAALRPPSGPSDVEKATRVFRLAAAHGKLAEARAIEVARVHEAGDAGFRFLEAIEGGTTGMMPSVPSTMSQTAMQFPHLRWEAGQARAARRAAEEAVEKLGHGGS
jgi:ketosteroid isomerase-like protein